MLRTLFAWAIGIPATALWGTLSLLGSLVERRGRWAHFCMVMWSRWGLKLMGVEIRVSGLENIRRDGPQVFAANHLSMADILVLTAALPVPFRFVAKSELFAIPFVGWHMRRAGFIPIERSRPRQAARAVIEAAARIQTGVNALIFPEGTRSSDGTLQRFKGGGFLLAIRAGVPVTPIAITGTDRIIAKGNRRIHPGVATVDISPQIQSRDFGDDREALAAATRLAIAARLGDGEG